MSDDKIRRALDKLQNAGPGDLARDVIGGDGLAEMQEAFIGMIDGPAAEQPMTPRIPSEVDIAAEAVDRHERPQ